MFYETIIVGAGAAGLFCGAQLKDYPHEFLILDQSPRPGIKLLASGAGQCNFTHGGDIKDFLMHYGTNGKKIRTILYRFNNQKTIEYFEDLGIATYTREDLKVFPKSLQANDILQVLLQEIQNNHGKLRSNVKITSIQKEEDIFHLQTIDKNKNKTTYTCQNLVLATGGRSYPKTGSDGTMYSILQDFHPFHIIEPKAALVPIYIENYTYASLAGISIPKVKIKKGKQEAIDDLLFTHKNLSGPVILNFSRFLDPGDRFSINFVPQGFKSGNTLFSPNDKRSILNYLIEETSLPKAMLQQFLIDHAIDPRSKAASIKLRPLEEALRHASYVVNGKASFDKAMVTSGGISLEEISTKTMEARSIKGLYFIGELLDIDGDTGGYNIQFAFSSAYTAAMALVNNSRSLASGCDKA